MISLGKSRHCQTWLERHSSWNENLQRKQNWTANVSQVKSSQFLLSEQPCEPKTLDVALNIAGVEKSENLSLFSTWRPVDSSFDERGVSDGGNFCLLWLGIFKSFWYSVGDTFYLQYSWPWAVVVYTLLAAVPWKWLRIESMQGYVFILTDFKKWCFDVTFLASISVSTVILRLGKVNFFSNGSWLTKTNFVLGLLVSLDCRQSLLEIFFCIIS